MKVLHVIPSVGPLRGGPSSVMRAMARDLAQAGLSIDVATTDDNGDGRLSISCGEAIVENGVTYRYFPRQTRFYTFSWPLTVWLAKHVQNYDLLHIHALFSYAAAPASFWARQYRVPYIVRPLGVLGRWGIENRRRWLKKISLRVVEMPIIAGAAAIHYTSEQEREEAAQFGIGHKAVVIPNAVDAPLSSIRTASGRFRAQYPQLSHRRIVLFLSRLDRKKGLDILLPAFARARRQYPDAALVVAGSGDVASVSRVREQAARLGIASDIVWTGFLTGDDKWAALADADIFVLPSYSENFGVAVVEAMTCGVPVIISDQVAIHREVTAAGAGLAVPCSVEAVAQALTAMLGDNTAREKMGANGYRLAQTKFSSQSSVQRLIDLYQSLAAAKSALIHPTVRPVPLSLP